MPEGHVITVTGRSRVAEPGEVDAHHQPAAAGALLEPSPAGAAT